MQQRANGHQTQHQTHWHPSFDHRDISQLRVAPPWHPIKGPAQGSWGLGKQPGQPSSLLWAQSQLPCTNQAQSCRLQSWDKDPAPLSACGPSPRSPPPPLQSHLQPWQLQLRFAGDLPLPTISTPQPS